MILTAQKHFQLKRFFSFFFFLFFTIYRMSSKAEELTQIRKITAEKYSKNKIHTLCVYKKFTGKNYVIWVKMSDLQENLDLRNLCHLASKKIKS